MSSRHTMIRGLLVLLGLVPSQSVFTQTINLADVASGNGGFVMYGSQYRGGEGLSGTGVGDVNGDGLADIVVIDPDAPNVDGLFVGNCYVVFGTSVGPAPTFDDIRAGNGGFVIHGFSGINVKRFYGVRFVGDVNGDGLDDFATVSHSGFPAWNDGECYVVFGKSTTTPLFFNDIHDGVGGYRISSIQIDGFAGTGVAAAGDVNDDGFDDILIGAPQASRDGKNEVGEVYLVFGQPTNTRVFLDDVAAGVGGIAFTGLAVEDRLGRSMGAAGDVNGDGIEDFLFGSSNIDVGGVSATGQGFVVFGSNPFTPVTIPDLLSGVGGFAVNGAARTDRASVNKGIGDMNEDGFDDFSVSAEFADPFGLESAGLVYVVFGKSTGETVELADIEAGSGGFAVYGSSENMRIRSNVEAPGDIDADGIPDMIISGRLGQLTAVMFGKATTEPVAYSDLLSSDGGIRIGYEIGPSFYVAEWAGDVNGDGFDDLVLTNGQEHLPDMSVRGALYVVFSPYGETRLRSSGGGNDGCLIATAAYGSPMAGELDALRALRDQRLLTNPLGATFADAYYHLSPPLADTLARNDGLRRISRFVLSPIVAFSRWLTESVDPKSN